MLHAFFALIADECKDISTVVRFVGEHDSIVKERFVGYVDVHKLDASSLADVILCILWELYTLIKVSV